VVVNMRVQQGEQVKAASPLFVLVVVSRPWVEANFKETELTHVRVGQKATVVLDTYPDVTWEAVVESLSPATGAEFAVLPPQNASGNWVKVVQRIPVRVSVTCREGDPALRVGMSTTVEIDTGHSRSFGSLMAGLAKIFGLSTASATAKR
jgi:membrane fusion protein (multidrug efflux system)